MSIAEAYDRHDALGLAQLVRRGEVTPTELLDEALRRVDERDGPINAVVGSLEHRARAAIAAGLPAGPFAGVPFLLKDLNTDVEGEVCTEGSRFFADRRAAVTSELVLRYDRAGLVTFGRTNSPERGLSPTTEPVLHGPTRNPWNHDHSAGGSSGGAGAAVAAGILPMAHATDGGGSIRIPASACGLFGLKPTRGRTPIGPPRGEGWNGMSIAHAVSWSVRDSAALLDATAGSSVGEPYSAPARRGSYLADVTTPPGRLRIGLTTTARPGTPVHADCVAATERAAALCEQLGHDVVPVDLPIDWSLVAKVQGTIVGANVGAAIRARAAELGREPTDDDLEPMALSQYRRAAEATVMEYADAQQAMQVLGRTLGAFYETVDAVLAPGLVEPPPPIGTLAGPPDRIAEWGPRVGGYTGILGLSNITGQPAASLPLHRTADGLPVGVQLIGRFGDEHTLFRLAGQLEVASPWWGHRPPSWW